MKIHFYLRFHTKVGQTLFVTGNAAAVGVNNPDNAYALSYLNNDFWQGSVEIDSKETPRLKYKYFLQNEDGFRIFEWENEREIDLSKTGTEEIQLVDTWNHAGDFENAFYTDPFQQTLLKENETKFKGKFPKQFSHIFKVKAPLLRKNEVLAISGSCKQLGNWSKKDLVLMARENGWWKTRVNLPKEEFPIQYKYSIYNIKDKSFVNFEAEGNRMLFGNAQAHKITILHDGFAHFPNNTWKGAGISVPVFSLRSKDSFGNGEFNDLKLLVDWAKKLGVKLIQILPVNDTNATHTWKDSYPYAAISVFALNPIYINLDTVAGKKYADLVKPLRKKQKQLNGTPEVDYEVVVKFKLSVLKELFLLQKDDFLNDEDYKEFFEQNKHWLVPYAAFCYLRDRNGSSDFTKWKLYSEYNKESIEKYVSSKAKHFPDIAFHYFIQYHLHCQLKEATDYAHKKGVIMKGDIPIGVYRYSCDTWVEPELYHLDMQSGAPPDDFAQHGQNWGFPTYIWERMEEDGFEWWHKRFVQMSNYFDAFRIDHVLGFFRIWSIPYHEVEGIMGHFVPALPVHRDELAQRNISFDAERFCSPFINDSVLWEMFGPNSDKFKQYLNTLEGGKYKLKPEFSTQRQVEKHFSSLELSDENGNLKQGLYDLLSNVIFFNHEGSDGKQFHFRFNMNQTSSFRHLDEHTRHQLQELYVDYFFRRQDNYWLKEAMKKLPALKSSTNMLICGEDLGLVPHCVPDVMKQLGILSLEIQRMPKALNKEFFHPGDAPYLSVVTPSTHDMSTIRGWWEEDRAKTQRFYNNELGQWGDAPAYCEPWISKAIIIQHLYSPAMWSIFQLQDLLGMSEKLRLENPQEERINIPADPNHYWKYRMHCNLEQLIKEKELNEEVKSYVSDSGR